MSRRNRWSFADLGVLSLSRGRVLRQVPPVLGLAALAVALLGGHGTARAAIALVNSTSGTTPWENTAPASNGSISQSFTVTGGNVLVVELVDRQTSYNTAFPATLSWNGLTLNAAVLQTSLAAASYRNLGIYYYDNPQGTLTTGTASIIGTLPDDTAHSGDVSYTAMTAFTLSGVNTVASPQVSSTSEAGNPESVTIGNILAGSYAAVNYCYGAGGYHSYIAANSGTASLWTNGINNTGSSSDILGYIAGLSQGSVTFSASNSNSGTAKNPFAVAVFSPAPLVWSGSTNSNWSLSGSDANWNVMSQSGTYTDSGVATFDNTNTSGRTNINIASPGVQPALVTFNNSSLAYSFSGGPISGTGSVVLTAGSAGSVTFSNSNNYTGATMIGGGTLQLGNGGASGSLSTSSTITVNGNLVFNRSNTVTQGTDFSAAAITGSGGLTQAGGGTLVLSASNAYSGGTTLAAGLVQVSGSASLGTGNLTLGGGALASGGATAYALANPLVIGTGGTLGSATNNGALTFSAASGTITTANPTLTVNSLVTIAGAIGDNGAGYGFTKAGAGLLIMGGANNYSGATTISGGTLSLTGSLTGTAIGPSGGTFSEGPSGVISGSASLNLGGGLATLAGTNTYTGATTVSGGTLLLSSGGGLGATAVSVKGGGTLLVQGNTSIAAGGSLTVAGGASPASQGVVDLRNYSTSNTLTVNGNLNLGNGAGGSGGSVLDFDLNSNGTADQIISTGAATLAGSNTINLNPAVIGGVVADGSYTLVTASSGLSVSNFGIGSRPAGFYHFSLATPQGSALVLTITGNATPGTAYWTGNASQALSDAANNWGVGSGITKSNWSTDSTGSSDTLQVPGASTNVVFTAASATGGSSGVVATTLDSPTRSTA